MAVAISVSLPSIGKPVCLRTEHLCNPLGIDARYPRFSWMDDSKSYAVRQQSYRITVGTDPVAVSKGTGDIWNSGTVASESQLATFNGKPLQPFTQYYWRVETADNKGKRRKSEVATFETGLMNATNWHSDWITDSHNTDFRPAPYFRKEFNVKRKIACARAYITSAGPYELSLNGVRVGDSFLDPAFTTYNKRLLYATHDVTALLSNGDNAVGVILGNSWYNHQALAVWGFEKADWRARPGFSLLLRIVYDDGSVESIVTDKSWTTSTGPLVYNNIYTGEHYDFTIDNKGWDMPGGSTGTWQPVVTGSFPTRNIVSQTMQTIRKTKSFKPVNVIHLSDTDYIFDFGQNMSGAAHIQVKGNRGTKLIVRYGEKLNGEGHLDQTNIDYFYRGDSINDPFQGDILTLSGGDDVFDNRFSYKGFRYAEVKASAPVNLDSNSITAFFVHSDVPRTGSVDASSSLVNSLVHATEYAYLSNLMGYPTDCPQREKNGWTGDAHLACQTGLYAFDGIAVYEKWMADHRDIQRGGILPDIIPTDGWGFSDKNLLDWTSTIALIPWNLYLFYGDSKCLRDCYGNIKEYVDFVDKNNPQHLTAWGRGDWVPVKTKSDIELTSSIYFYVDAYLLHRIANILGNVNDARHYGELASNIKTAINARFLNRVTGKYASGSMTELSMPLYWGIVPDDMRAKVARALADNVNAHDGHIDCGVLGTKTILNALSENGYADIAYAMATKDTYPSWGYWIKRGQTTLTENWNIDQGRDASCNHIMYGEIGAWFYKALGGVYTDEKQPGFKNILLRPNFIKAEQHFSARHNSPYGKIVSKWAWQDDKTVIYDVEVPAGSTAAMTLDRTDIINVKANEGKSHVRDARLSGGAFSCKLPSGNYQFTITMQNQ